MVINRAKTRRTGWWGAKLHKLFSYLSIDPKGLISKTATGTYLLNDPIKAKERLVEDGVDFAAPDGEPKITGDDCLTYHVVTLTYEA